MRLLSRSLVCQQAVQLMNDYVDGTLSQRQRRRLEAHLAGCDACTAYLEQLRVTIRASAVVNVDDVDPAVLESLVELFERYQEDT
ncbi:MAG: zf-HC2 domain-containing protein [Acidimicrobiales bacterium]